LDRNEALEPLNTCNGVEDLRDVESHEDKKDLVVVLLKVPFKENTQVLDILSRSWELEPVALIAIYPRWFIEKILSCYSDTSRHHWRTLTTIKNKWLANPALVRHFFFFVPESSSPVIQPVSRLQFSLR
jgi:hypothetical protein